MLQPRETVVVKGGELAGAHGVVVDVSRHRVLVAFDPALFRKANGTQTHGGGVVSFAPGNLRTMYLCTVGA
jgi:ribosomal protein L24